MYKRITPSVCVLGEELTNKGLSTPKLSQITTKSLSNPEWMNGRTFEENVDLCESRCLAREDCTGLQVCLQFTNDSCNLLISAVSYGLKC